MHVTPTIPVGATPCAGSFIPAPPPLSDHTHEHFPNLQSILIDNSLFIDNSTLETFTTCPRAAFYQLGLKRTISRKKAALGFGGAVHKILEQRYLRGTNPLLGEDPKLCLQAGLDILKDSAIDPEDFRTPDYLIEVWDKYQAKYPVETFEVVDGFVEKEFAIPLGVVYAGSLEVPVVWTGRIDAIIGDRDLYRVLDHKTTTMMGPSYFEEFNISSQMMGYTWAASHLLGREINGVLINAIALRKPTKTGKGIEFERMHVYITPENLVEWRNNTLYVIGDLLRYWAQNYFPMHTKQCVGKYGRCQYYDVCTLPQSQRLTMLNTNLYEKTSWNALSSLQTHA